MLVEINNIKQWRKFVKVANALNLSWHNNKKYKKDDFRKDTDDLDEMLPTTIDVKHGIRTGGYKNTTPLKKFIKSIQQHIITQSPVIKETITNFSNDAAITKMPFDEAAIAKNDPAFAKAIRDHNDTIVGYHSRIIHDGENPFPEKPTPSNGILDHLSDDKSESLNRSIKKMKEVLRHMSESNTDPIFDDNGAIIGWKQNKELDNQEITSNIEKKLWWDIIENKIP